MEQTVYIDLFFMINFSMDFLCFFLVFELLGGKMLLGRTLLASGLGGIYANISLFIPIEGIWAIFLDIAVCILMCLVAFGKRGSVLVNTLVYIAISMTLGGFMTALFSLFNRIDLPLYEIDEDGISAWLLLILALISAVGALLGGKFFRRKSSKRYAELSIFIGATFKKILSFYDSGNLLHDPISGRPCIIVDADALSDILPKTVIKAAKEKSIGISEIPEAMMTRIRLIPTRTATGEGLMLAVKADKIIISDKKSEREVNALLAVCELGNSADGCQALLPTELMI